MNTRQDIIQHFCSPLIPENSCSLEGFLLANKEGDGPVSTPVPTPVPTCTDQKLFASRPAEEQWVGAKLIQPISQKGFYLASSFCTVFCAASNKSQLFFDFSKTAKHVPYGTVFSLLRQGDHVLIPIRTQQVGRISKGSSAICLPVQKLVLVAINTKTELAQNQTSKIKKRGQKVATPSSLNADLQEKWFAFLDLAHKALQQLGLKQVQTPTLTRCIGTEPELDLFETKGDDGQKLFLASSPEMNMKRLLCQGWTDIYEIKKCYRNKEKGLINSIEFTLLEWYRAYGNLINIQADLNFLLNFLSQKLFSTPFPKLKIVSLPSLFMQYLGIDLTPHCSAKDFALELEKRNWPFNPKDTVGDLFQLLFLNGIEPHLDKHTPFIVVDWPPFQKAYARIDPKSGYALRFELFWQGIELANAFNEVHIKEEQTRRFVAERVARQKAGKPTLPIPHVLLNEMEGGFPPCAGIALGLDRLFLAFYKLKSLSQIRPL